MSLFLSFFLNLLLVFYATLLAFKVSPSFGREVVVDGLPEGTVLPVAVGFPIFIALALHLVNSNSGVLRLRLAETLARSFVGCVGGGGLFAAGYALFTNTLFGRYVVLLTILFSWVGTTVSYFWLAKLLAKAGRGLYFIGTETDRASLEEVLKSQDGVFTLIAAGVTAGEQLEPESSLRAGALARVGISEVVVGPGVELPEAAWERLMQLPLEGVRVSNLNGFCERYFHCISTNQLADAWFLESDMRHLHPVFNLVKRFFDVGISLTGLVFSLPFAGVIALALKLQDGGPVFYAQTRMGFRGRPFRIFKFRSMTTEAEKNGPQWASKGDARVTPIGRILRGTRLDELPQFWNILRGEMSFIGPRPERVEFSRDIEREVPFFRLRTLVKPGLTGWAQVNYPYGASVEDARRKLSYDLYYIKYVSVFLDLVIILRTFIAMVKGAR
jgi:exopolysaccharide biosynthesis polyprenyl glycosylphosphotransferase